jgi:hypothetical protein
MHRCDISSTITLGHHACRLMRGRGGRRCVARWTRFPEARSIMHHTSAAPRAKPSMFRSCTHVLRHRLGELRLSLPVQLWHYDTKWPCMLPYARQGRALVCWGCGPASPCLLHHLPHQPLPLKQNLGFLSRHTPSPCVWMLWQRVCSTVALRHSVAMHASLCNIGAGASMLAVARRHLHACGTIHHTSPCPRVSRYRICGCLSFCTAVVVGHHNIMRSGCSCRTPQHHAQWL